MSIDIAIAQINPTVGAFEANVKKIKAAYQQACSQGARLLMTPELGVCGYPPHDLIDRPEIFERNEKAIQDLAQLTRNSSCALLVGHVSANPDKVGRFAQNSISVLEGGKVVFKQSKTLLPTYDVFDESRYFEPAAEMQLWEWEGRRIAIAICEDLWGQYSIHGRHLYRAGATNPIETYRRLGADLVLSVAASPYEWGKQDLKDELYRDVARSVGVPLVYVNQVGATDEILFDGGSFVLDAQGKRLGRLPFFQEATAVVRVNTNTVECPGGEWSESNDSHSAIDILHRGLVLGIQDYFRKTGFKKAIIGLSGGIDSAVVAALAVEALGPENVVGIGMPSQYSSSHSLEDAEVLAHNLGIESQVRPIKFLYSVASRTLSEGLEKPLSSLPLENLQSRLRGLILMTLSNEWGALVLTTGNKSELATGYCTLYGDMVGALAPLGDVLKTRVYELAREINRSCGLNGGISSVIPERCLTKAPSAELRPDQTDQDTLPPYDLLDQLLIEYIEKQTPLRELPKDPWVKDVLNRLECNEYKRRQSAPILKISSKAFGIGRRVPIAKTWERE